VMYYLHIIEYLLEESLVEGMNNSQDEEL